MIFPVEVKKQAGSQKRKAELAIIWITGKAKDKIGHFNSISPREMYCPCRKLQNLYGQIVHLRLTKLEDLPNI